MNLKKFKIIEKKYIIPEDVEALVNIDSLTTHQKNISTYKFNIKMNKVDAVKVLAEDKTFENELKYKGDNDLEVRIKILEKEVDTLKTIINLKDIELDTLKNNLVKIKELHNAKVLDERFVNDLANNTPHSKMFDKE